MLWIGLPRLMKSPEQRTPAFAGLVVACACALTLIAVAAQHTLFGAWAF
jgi:hypothetical protein